MTRYARLGLVAALLLAVVFGFLLKGWVSVDADGGVVTTTVTATGASPSLTTSPDGELPDVATDDGDSLDDGDVDAGAGHGDGPVAGGGGSFSISGNVATALEPGATATINLTITNPNNRPLALGNITVAIGTITAPNATTTYPCTAADFSVDQTDGETDLLITANSSRSLQQLGLATSQWPSLSMLNRSVSQEGCRGATVGLVYDGTAVWGDQ